MLTDEAIFDYDTNAKVNPPIRTKADVDAIREGLRDCTIDVIATDHAPHTEDEKKVEFDLAPFGISGLETALSLSLKLVKEDVVSLPEVIKKLTINPAQIVKIGRGTLKVGSIADVVIFDPETVFTVDRMKFRSKGKNSPFHGWRLSGRVEYTIVGGSIVYAS
jgi:dihydroorotase